MKIELLGKRVLITPHVQEKSVNGIIIPDCASHKPTHGVVAIAGCECDKVNEGTDVIFPEHAGSEIEVGGEKYLLMNEDDIIAVIVG